MSTGFYDWISTAQGKLNKNIPKTRQKTFRNIKKTSSLSRINLKLPNGSALFCCFFATISGHLPVHLHIKITWPLGLLPYFLCALQKIFPYIASIEGEISTSTYYRISSCLVLVLPVTSSVCLYVHISNSPPAKLSRISPVWMVLLFVVFPTCSWRMKLPHETMNKEQSKLNRLLEQAHWSHLVFIVLVTILMPKEEFVLTMACMSFCVPSSSPNHGHH